MVSTLPFFNGPPVGHGVHPRGQHRPRTGGGRYRDSLHNFRRYHHQLGEVREAVSHTLHTTGRAMLFTTVVLSIAFFTYAQSSLNNLFSFGLITGITIIVALLADLLLAPALMTLIHHPRERSVPNPAE